MSAVDKFIVSPLLRRLSFPAAVGTTLFLVAGITVAVSLHFHLVQENPSPVQLYVTTSIAGIFCFGSLIAYHLLTRTPPLPPGSYARHDIERDFPEAPIPPRRAEFKCKNSGWIRDDKGRTVLVRGVNLGGATKLPTTPNGATYNPDNLGDPKSVSFVGRPFPLDEADVHLGRLRAWGYTFLRFLITWEAVEHDAPGQYDEEYLEYLLAVIRKCDKHGISVFIDPHQDVWSRWTGGDGAPGWTLELVGFDLDKIYSSGSAITHQGHGDPFPKMVWVTNYTRLAAATMFTLFFGGDVFAPLAKVDTSGTQPTLVYVNSGDDKEGGKGEVPNEGTVLDRKLESIQSYLQRHYCDAMQVVAAKLKNEKNVVGFDSLNEPSAGYIGRPSPLDSTACEVLKSGWRIDPFTGFKLGAGLAEAVDFFESPFVYGGKRVLNAKEEPVWQDGMDGCVWKQHKIWDMVNGKPTLLKPNYFQTNPKTGAKVEFLNQHLVPFWKRMAQSIRKEIPDAIIFAEPHVDLTGNAGHITDAPLLSDDDVGHGYVYAKHYYDGIALMTKHFWPHIGLDMTTQLPVLGHKWVIKAHSKVMNLFKKEASKMGQGGSPVLIGEIGIPFDMHQKEAFKTGKFNRQISALNTTLRSLEGSLLSFTLWNYTSDNSNERGDLWNDEDLSLFSPDQVTDPTDLHSGGRALEAAVRPYPCRICGTPLRSSFDPYKATRNFELAFRADESVTSDETVIFLPRFQYPNGVNVKVSEGTWNVDWDKQTLVFRAPNSGVHWMRVTAATTVSAADA